jgi:GT2 family glycosyltransferase
VTAAWAGAPRPHDEAVRPAGSTHPDGVGGPRSGAVDCTAIVVTYNSAADLPGLLDTLPRAAAGLRIRVLVVDNDSADDIGAAVAGRPDVTLIRAGANLGYAGGINVGRANAGPTRTIAILNPDLRLAPGSLTWLVSAAERDGAAVPRFVDEAGGTYPSLRREPSILRALGDGLLGKRWAGRPGRLSEMVWEQGRYELPGPVDWATGAVLVLAADADAAVGPWDDGFFLYSEETDYCRRLRAAGRAVQYVPEAQVTHRGGGSGTGPALAALNEVNRVRYFRKYHGPLPSAVFRLSVLLGQLIRFRRPGSRAALRALTSRRHRAALPGRHLAAPPAAPAGQRSAEYVG